MGVRLTDLRYAANTMVNGKVMPMHRNISFILDKLIKDGHVIEKIGTDVNRGKKTYFITTDGLLFNQKGGYLTVSSLPINSPSDVNKKAHNNPSKKGINSKNGWKNDLMNDIIYPLLVALIAGIILKILL